MNLLSCRELDEKSDATMFIPWLSMKYEATTSSWLTFPYVEYNFLAKGLGQTKKQCSILTPHQVGNCSFYTWVFEWIKQVRYNMLIGELWRCSWGEFAEWLYNTGCNFLVWKVKPMQIGFLQITSRGQLDWLHIEFWLYVSLWESDPTSHLIDYLTKQLH